MPTAITTLKNTKVSGQLWDNYYQGNDLLHKLKSNTLIFSGITKIMRGLEIGKDKVNVDNNEIQFLTGEDIFRFGINGYSYISENIYNKYKISI